MEMIVTVLFLLGGILLIVKGGDLFVETASWMAEISGIPTFVVGATVVSFATTLPEVLVSVLASSQGKMDMAVGNAVGSVTANMGLILGVALVCMPSVVRRRDLWLRMGLMVAGLGYLWMASGDGWLTLGDSVGLMVLLGVAVWDNIRSAKNGVSGFVVRDGIRPMIWLAKGMGFVLGGTAIAVGAQLLVVHGSGLARGLGVPESIVAVTVLAVGTSLPELVTTLTAISKKQVGLSVGNLVGANIMDVTLILPLCALVGGGAMPMTEISRTVDLPVTFAMSLVAVVPTLLTGKFARWQGWALLGGYGVYLVVVCGW